MKKNTEATTRSLCSVVLKCTVTNQTVGPDIGTSSILQRISIPYCETIPFCFHAEVKRLVQHPPCILSIQYGGIGIEIALRQVIVRRLDARKTTIYTHSVTHRKGIGCRCVAVIGACGHPHHSIMRHCKGLCLLNGG